MSLKAVPKTIDPKRTLNVFCSPSPNGWRVHLDPAWAPAFLMHCFDKNYEAFPVSIDLEDLDRYMGYHSATYQKRIAVSGGVELTATGEAADALAAWLSTAFATGFRPRSGSSQ